MRRQFLLLSFGLLLLVAIPVVPRVMAAQTFTAKRLNAIEDRCGGLQTRLDQVQRNDLVARTNRGREYENINRQLQAFLARLRYNKIAAAQPLGKLASDVADDVQAFRDAYVRYDDSMTALIQIDCTKYPVDFARALETAKVLRKAVGVEVTKAGSALSKFRQAVQVLRADVPKAGARS